MSRATLSVRVQPRSRSDMLAGLRDGVVIVRVTAPPLDGRANDAVCQLLAGVLYRWLVGCVTSCAVSGAETRRRSIVREWKRSGSRISFGGVRALSDRYGLADPIDRDHPGYALRVLRSQAESDRWQAWLWPTRRVQAVCVAAQVLAAAAMAALASFTCCCHG
jgi:uncharacterized protein YggU (UPF0235/DUF167 family)